MRDVACDLARRAIARHLEVPVTRVRARDDLDGDLGLDAFDVTLVVLRLEEEEGVEIPYGDLDRVTTVSDLAALLRTARGDSFVTRKSA